MTIRVVLTVVTAVSLFLGGWRGDVGAADTVVPFTSTCEDADNFGWVKGENHCFAIATVLPQKAVSRPVLRIYLHGSRKRGSSADIMYRHAARTPVGTVSVAMLRPEHFDWEGRQSSDKSYGNRNWATAEDIDEMAAAVRRLRKHYNASHVVMIGQSSGSDTIAVMLGRHPGTVDAALLFACACDKVAKAEYRNRRVRPRDLNPIDYVDKIPPSARIIVLIGTRHKTNPASICEPYIARLKGRGVSAPNGSRRRQQGQFQSIVSHKDVPVGAGRAKQGVIGVEPLPRGNNFRAP